MLYPRGVPGLGLNFGVWPTATDGYDGGLSINPQGQRGGFLMIYHEHGPEWTGRTGFYVNDRKAPIPLGSSKTWRDIYLWVQNWTLDPPDRVLVWVWAELPDGHPPPGFVGHLVLEYVPESLGWTGPTEFWLDLNRQNEFTLPIATTTNPLEEGVRMSLTVHYIPEPSALAALLSGLAAAGVLGVRRRR